MTAIGFSFGNGHTHDYHIYLNKAALIYSNTYIHVYAILFTIFNSLQFNARPCPRPSHLIVDWPLKRTVACIFKWETLSGAGDRQAGGGRGGIVILGIGVPGQLCAIDPGLNGTELN